MGLTSLELNWIRRKVDKDLVLPEVVLGSSASLYGGCYWHPSKREALIDGIYYPLDRGLIEVSAIEHENIGSIIAHEWRHHWQFYKGWDFEAADWGDFAAKFSYEDAIANYFINIAKEADAFKFQLKYEPPSYGPEWEYWILRKLGRAK